MLPDSLTNFEIKNYDQNELKFSSAYLRRKLFKIKYGAYAINLDEHESIGTNWLVLYVNGDNVTYFDS